MLSTGGALSPHQSERVRLAEEFSTRARADVGARNLGRALFRRGSIMLDWGSKFTAASNVTYACNGERRAGATASNDYVNTGKGTLPPEVRGAQASLGTATPLRSQRNAAGAPHNRESCPQ